VTAEPEANIGSSRRGPIMTLSEILLLKSAREVNITFEHCSVYSKIVTGKVQVVYFENVFFLLLRLPV
jgi:hypothetical protein